MTVKLLIGPPACGKTQACIQKIREVQSNHPLSTIWVLVPDSQNLAYFRRRLANAGGGLGVHVGTFSALFTEILEEHRVFTPVISPALEHRLVQETVNGTFEEAALQHFAAIRHKPGFIQALGDVFSELRSAYVQPDQFLQYTQGAVPSKRELADLYRRFIDRLNTLNWIDRDGQIWQAISLLQNDPDAAAAIRLVVVDGFSSFAGARQHFLKALSEQVHDMVITLPGDRYSTRPVQHGTAAEIAQLADRLSPEVTTLTSTPHLPSDIQSIEKHVLDPGQFPKTQTSHPIFLEAYSQSAEAREALRWIKTLHQREGYPLDGCAIFAGDLPAYRPLLRSSAAEFGIKIHFSHPDALIGSPAIQSILNLLQLPLDDYQTRTLLIALQSPFFDFKLEEGEVEDLKRVSQHARIVMGRGQWEEAWETLTQTAPEDDAGLIDERQFKDPLEGIDLHSLQERFSEFWTLFPDSHETRSQSGWISWLEKTLEGLNFYDRLIDERDQEACAGLGKTFRALILSEQVVGSRKVDYAGFLSDLQGTLQGARLEEPRAARRNALYIGKMSEARASRFDAVVLMGFSEGIFPVVEHPDPFLDEVLRRDLGLQPRLARDQAGTFYQAFTRANARLLITRPYLAEDGEQWEASHYWESARNLFEKKALRKISQNTPLNQMDAASPQELLFRAVLQGCLADHADPQLAIRWEMLQQARTILTARRSKKARGPYEGVTDQIAENLTEIFSSKRPWSASRFETYTTCPYQFYVQYVLGLEAIEPPELGLNAQQVGLILHRILELVYAQAGENADLAQLLDLLNEKAGKVFHTAPKKYGFRPSPLWSVEQAQFLDMLCETIIALEAESQGWKPTAFEKKFGFDSAPYLDLDLGTESILLRGLIDRVDQSDTGTIRVVDYKTGGSHLAKRDFEEGRRLQLPIYALAAQDALHLGEVEEGFYWSIRNAQASSFKLSKYKADGDHGLSAARKVMDKHVHRSLSGIRAGKFPPQPPRGGCPNYCPAAQWCWRYQAGW